MKSKMWLEFTVANNRRWIDILPKLIKNYNISIHRTIGMTPKQAQMKKNYQEINKRLNTHISHKIKKPLLKVGDHVRLSKVKDQFEKSATNNWTSEIFKIKQIKMTDPITYIIEDLHNEEIKGSFYEKELQKTIK